jgi:TolB-like protein
MRRFLSLCILVLVGAVSSFSQERPTLVVLDFTTTGLSSNEIQAVMSFLSMSFYRTNRFNVIDSSDRDFLLKKQNTGKISCNDEPCLITLGKLLSVDFIVTGSINKKNSRFSIQSKMIDTKSGKTLRNAEGNYQSIDMLVDELGAIANILSQDGIKTASRGTRETKSPEESDTEIYLTEDKSSELMSDTSTPAGPSIDETSGEDKQNTSSPVQSKNKIVFGAMGGWTLPLGSVSEILPWTVTVFSYIHYLISVEQNYIVLGLSGGYQSESTLSRFPIQYELMSIPILVDFHYRFGIVPDFLYTEIGASGGVSLNFINYNNDAMPNFMKTKLMIKAIVTMGLEIGFVDIDIYDTFFIIMFDGNMYPANSVGIGVEIRL